MILFLGVSWVVYCYKMVLMGVPQWSYLFLLLCLGGIPKKKSTEIYEEEGMQQRLREVTPEPIEEQRQETPKPVSQYAGMFIDCVYMSTDCVYICCIWL